jgi:hypothetical protein
MTRAMLAALACLLAVPDDGHAERTRTFAGSLQLDYLAVPTTHPARDLTFDGATVELSLKLSVDVTDNVTANVKVCYACHGFEAGMAFVDFRIVDELHVRVGRMTPAFGAFPMRHDPANHRTSDKPLPYDMGRMLRHDLWNEGILPAPWVDNGVEVGGTRFFEHGQLDYAVYAMGGPKGDADAADFDFTASRSGDRYYVDNNSEPILGARLAGSMELRGHGTLALGASAMAGRYDPASRLSFVIAGADVAVDLEWLVLRGEYLLRRTEMDLGGDPATRFKFGPKPDGTFDDFFLKEGFYVEGEVPMGRAVLLARWDGLRRKGNVLTTSGLDADAYVLRSTVGSAIRIGAATWIKTSVQLYQFDNLPRELAIHGGVATPF